LRSPFFDRQRIAIHVWARQTRIPPATISNVLAGRRNISQQNAVRLGDYFVVSPVAFLAAGGV
jgi:plasmid maintenance system antidote protein VapI